ncbi:uncharacterized protein LOC129761359 [Toxorhynchites rutilus septentrionalis]|uniref:uncharacterized protein LOC129761359 n=1 Tax=Toxorhynchites rutilus septentrionalis TaxID=329112 RepID=UPI0024796A5A|nr:uncharacterized protein LOC129761359 [Toxorhynchites rutilus septentrionalis]
MHKDIRTAFTRTKKENVRNQEQQTTVTESSASHYDLLESDVSDEGVLEEYLAEEIEPGNEAVTIEILDASKAVVVDSQLKVASRSRSENRNWMLVREIDSNQPLITSYYECTQRIVNIAEQLQTDSSSGRSSNSTPCILDIETTSNMASPSMKSKLLLELVNLFNVSGKRIKFADEFKTYCTYMYILAGPKAYNTLKSTLPLISLRTAQKHLHKTIDRVKEGELRVEQLKKFLELTDSPPVVWLSEDATRIVSKLQIDPASGNIIGTLLPKDDETGMPVLLQRDLESVSQMKKELNSSTLTINAVVTIARPLKKGAPLFCLMVVGCDNKFTAAPVTKRRIFVIEKLNSVGILVPGSSSDGDSRYTCSQKQFCGMYKNVQLTNVPADWIHWFNTPFENDYGHHCIQDTVHIMGKTRNNLFNSGSGIRIGNFIASKAHLRIVVQNMPRTIHKLNVGDILSNDKMNYSSITKLLNPKIEEWVLTNIPGGSGTVMYLKIMRYDGVCCNGSPYLEDLLSEIPFETPITNEERNDDEVNTYADADVDLDDEHNYLDLDLDHLDITVASNGDSSMHAEMYVPLDVEDELRLMLESANNIEIKHLIKENGSKRMVVRAPRGGMLSELLRCSASSKPTSKLINMRA